MPQPVGRVTRGGVYGREANSGGHRCGRCATPFTASGGNEACPNNRPSQTVPYEECQSQFCGGITHEDCWSDYNLPEDDTDGVG